MTIGNSPQLKLFFVSLFAYFCISFILHDILSFPLLDFLGSVQ